MSLTSNFVDAETALRIGLVNQVVAHADLVPFALDLAAAIAEQPRDMVVADARGLGPHRPPAGRRGPRRARRVRPPSTASGTPPRPTWPATAQTSSPAPTASSTPQADDVDDDAIGDAATELLDMRANRRVVPDLPPPLRPQTLGDAYAIQHRVVAALWRRSGGRRIGYKVACTNEHRPGRPADRPTGVRPADVADHLAERHDARRRPVHPSGHRGRVRLPRRQRRRAGRRRSHARHDRRAHRRADPGHRDRRPPVRVVGGRRAARRRRQRDPRLVGPRRAGHRLARPRPRGRRGVGHPQRRARHDRLGCGRARSSAQRDGLAGRRAAPVRPATASRRRRHDGRRHRRVRGRRGRRRAWPTSDRSARSRWPSTDGARRSR